MSLRQKIKKIRRMSLGEIIFRVVEQVNIRMERKTYKGILNTVNKADFNFFRDHTFFDAYKRGRIKELLTQPGFARKISPLLDSSRRETFLKAYPQEAAETIRRANAFLAHKFSFLGVSFQLPQDIPWQSDPLSLNPYSTGFYQDVDIFTNQNAGDVKHVWEINRLQFLIELAKAYYLSEDEKYRQKLEFFIRDWNQKNPYKTGIAWASALEVGVRVLALIWTLNFYLAGKHQDNEVLALLLKLIYLHGWFLHDNLSLYFSPYNHLIGETAGLFAVGYLFPGFKNAKKHEKKSWRILEDQIVKQFHADGGLVEQATFYHHFTLGFFFQALAFKRLNGETLPERFMGRLEKATEFALFMTKPEGRLPYLGDIDDARSLYFSNPTHWDFSSFQAIGAALFKREDMKQAAGAFKEEAFWILSDGDRRRFEELKVRDHKPVSVHFPESGYTLFRKDALFAMMDHGPLAHGVFHDETFSAAHGHADLLAIELSAFDQSFLIDPGFSNYRGDFNWHRYFRSTAAHNTIEIDGQSQAKQGGILQWAYAPKFKVLARLQENWVQGVCAEHYGYHRLSDSPTHRRCLLFIDNSFFISVDWVFSRGNENGKHSIYYNQHFDSPIDLEMQADRNRLLAKGKNGNLALQYFSNTAEKLSFEINKGGKGPDKGWISPTYLARTAAFTARIGGDFSLPFILLTLYLPYENENEWKVEGQLPDFTIGRGETVYSFHLEPAAKKEFHLRKHKSGKEESVTVDSTGLPS